MRDALAGRGLGHTPAEFVAQRAAVMDMEDLQAAARESAAFRQWQQQQSADTSANISELEHEAAVQREHHAEWGPKVAEKRARKREIWKVVNANERLRGRDG
jgi:hypothetical protein